MNIQTVSQIVQNFLLTVKAKLQTTLDDAIGSVWVALAEANAGTAYWLQSLILQVLAWTRAQTSCGSALDLWMAQFGFLRLPGVAASNFVTLGANIALSAPVTIASNTYVQTPAGIQYLLAAGTVLESGQTSFSVLVTCTVAGSIGNAAVDQINQFVTNIPGIDTVTNTVAFSNGVDPEADSAFRTRFIAYIGSLQKGTKLAVTAAIQGVQQGLTFNLVEFLTPAGAAAPGFFYAVVNDGTGNPSSTLLTAIYNAIDAVKALGIQFQVIGPTSQTATISMSITLASGYQLSAVTTLIQTAIQNYIATIPIGGTLYWSYLYKLIYDASPGIVDVSSLTINNATADLAATSNGVITAGTIGVAA